MFEQAFKAIDDVLPRAPLRVIDHNKALVGDDLRDFVNQELFPYFHCSPHEIMDEIAALDAESAEVLSSIRGLLK